MLAQALLATTLLAGPASASPAPAELRTDLRGVIGRALERYPELAVVAAERQGAEALRRQADLARWTPRVVDTSIFGLVPGARGSVFDSPDTNRDLDDFGIFYRTRLEATLPLFSFGRLAGAQAAARVFVESKDAKARSRRAAATGLAARAYFGWLLAGESLDLLADLRRRVDDLLERLEHPAEQDEEPDPLDLYKVRSYRFQLDRQEAEARRGQFVASRGLDELAGPGVRPAATGLVALDVAEPDLERGLAEALATNPDIQEAATAARARRLFARATAKEALPVLGIEGRFEYGRAPGRETQDNPFVYEPFNVRSLSAAFGLRWDLSFWQIAARSAKDSAEARELEAKAEALAARLRVEVGDRHARLVGARAIHEVSRRALSTAANWLRVAEENHGLGTASVKDVIDAYAAWVQTRTGHHQAVHDLNLAVIDWRLALGREPLEQGETP